MKDALAKTGYKYYSCAMDFRFVAVQKAACSHKSGTLEREAKGDQEGP